MDIVAQSPEKVQKRITKRKQKPQPIPQKFQESSQELQEELEKLSKDPKKIRVRVSFEILRQIAPWRVQEFTNRSHH